MGYAVYSATAAVPNLAYGLRKIAHTPRARLQVGYRLLPKEVDCYTPACECDRAQLCPHWEVRGLRPLGNALLVDRILAGGIVGEALPLANLEICVDQANPLGANLDVCG
jgi:hypothetical protein